MEEVTEKGKKLLTGTSLLMEGVIGSHPSRPAGPTTRRLIFRSGSVQLQRRACGHCEKTRVGLCSHLWSSSVVRSRSISTTVLPFPLGNLQKCFPRLG